MRQRKKPRRVCEPLKHVAPGKNILVGPMTKQVDSAWDPRRLYTLEVVHELVLATMDENGGVSGQARLTLVRRARLED